MFPSLNQECCHDDSTIHEISLERIECVSALARYIGRHSVLFVNPSTINSHDPQSSNSGDDEDFKLLSIDEMEYLHSSHASSSEVTLADLFRPSQRTMMFGDSNVGKSYVMQYIALAFATGEACFCFHKSKPARIVYLDGELGDSFVPRLIMLNGGDLNSLVRKNLKVMTLRGMSLDNLGSKEAIIHKIEGFSPNLVIADNIISLFGEAVKGNVAPLKSFVEMLEKAEIAVALVHHTGKTAETYKGPIELEALCQNVIHLKGRTQIEDEFSKEGMPVPPRMAALKGAKDIGPVVSMSFKKCKICPELEKFKNYYYLPINGQWSPLCLERESTPFYGVKNDAVDIHPNAKLLVAENLTSDTSMICDGSHDTGTNFIANPPVELIDEQRRILEAAEKSKITNASVRTLIRCSESKASNLLKDLVDMKLLRRLGSGRSTEYTIVGKQVQFN